MMKFVLSVILFVALNGVRGNQVAANFVMTPEYSKAYMEILRLKFSSAQQIIASEKSKNPSNAVHAYLLSYIDFLKVIISEQEKDYETLIDNKSARIKQVDAISKKSPWRLYSLAQMNLQSGIASVKAGDYLKAAIDINKANNQFHENNKLFPSFKPNKAGVGLLHILIGTIPDSYKWISGMFGFTGDVKSGLKELQDLITSPKTVENYPYLYYECLFLTSFITFNLAVSDVNTSLLLNVIDNETTNKEIGSSPLLIYAVSSFYSNKGMNDRALKLLLGRPADASYYPFHYLDYLTGIALLNKLDSKARVYFLRFVTNFKGSNFIKSAYQKLAWSYLTDDNIKVMGSIKAEDNLIEYRKYISRAKIFGTDEMDHDKEALKEAIRNKAPNSELLKVRLLFDGGYYDRAMELASLINEVKLTEPEKIELTYRRGRINHLKGNLDQAKELYLTTYKAGKGLPVYYAANALLNLGNIYEAEEKPKEAMWCYRECLELNFNEYQSSIQQKAKAGINRLK